MKNNNSTKSANILKILKKMILYSMALIAAYITIGYFLHLVVFPENIPEISGYFEPGQVLNSEAEGFRQTVVKQEYGLVSCSLEIAPHASGPPSHVHTDFDEIFEVENGMLSIIINGEIKKILPGEKLLVSKGTPHKPFNETADTLHSKGVIAFPEKFAFGLVQIYGLMDHNPDFGKLPVTLFMLAPIQQAGFDSYLSDGPPVFIQKTLSFILTPAARLMGFKSYYKEFNISKSI
ncbi:cupin domain-containing protein [Cyclobacteriaceae bacterium YHN15]|nr:cupin domain-containing protein [Cyclobacteriaceae bacterium YHN15]